MKKAIIIEVLLVLSLYLPCMVQAEKIDVNCNVISQGED